MIRPGGATRVSGVDIRESFAALGIRKSNAANGAPEFEVYQRSPSGLEIQL